jgi:hypothetical protein
MILSTLLCALLVQQSLNAGDADGAKPPASEQSVVETYRKMEQADRKGDTDLWFSLRDKKTLEGMSPAVRDAIRKGGRSRPSVRYEPVTVRVQSDRAVLIGKVTDPVGGTTQYQSVLFVVEGGGWKVAREQWSESPIDPFVLHGMLPPESGSFVRAGQPWKRLGYADINAEIVGKKDVVWKLQATFDESFVYIRYEWPSPIPAPGAKLKPELANAGKTGGPPSPPAMQIKLRGLGPEYDSGQHDLTVSATDVVSSGGGTPSVNYSMTVKNAGGDDLFEFSLGNDSAGRLLTVQERSIEVRVPVGGFGLADMSKAIVQLEEAGSVLHLLPYKAERFGTR